MRNIHTTVWINELLRNIASGRVPSVEVIDHNNVRTNSAVRVHLQGCTYCFYGSPLEEI